MNGRIQKGWLVLSIAFLAGLCACSGSERRVAELKTETQSVQLGSAKTVTVELKMGAGEMKVTGGANNLMEGTFTYNDPAWKPRIDYRANGDRGTLTIEEPEGTHTNLANHRYSWDVRLNNKVPLEVHVELGAGKTDLELGDLYLTQLHVEMGAGEATVDLVGNWKHDVDAHIEGGVGKATIKLPRQVGVRLTVEGGLGSVSAPDFEKDGDAFVNRQYRKSPVTINVRVEGGVGKVILELSGGPI